MVTEAEARELNSESEDSEASCSSTEGLVVPEGIPSLRGVRYVHGAFPESFLRQLERVREGTPVTLASGNMYADRRFLRDEALAKDVLRYLPKHLGFEHVLSDMRFIEYPPGGHILPHTDGVRRDQVTGLDSTHSMLLFTRDVPEGEGGETEFLDGVGGRAGSASEAWGASGLEARRIRDETAGTPPTTPDPNSKNLACCSRRGPSADPCCCSRTTSRIGGRVSGCTPRFCLEETCTEMGR